MKRSCNSLLALGIAGFCLPASAQSFLGSAPTELRITLVIKADGSCSFTNESVQPRKFMEMQVRAWERFSKQAQERADDDNQVIADAAPKPQTQPLTDEQLAAKIRELSEERSDDGDSHIELVEVTTNQVRLISTGSFGSLSDLLSNHIWTWGPSLLMVENARLELDTNRQFRITFSPARGGDRAERHLKTAGQEWKRTKVKFEWKLILPGKILSSSFSGLEDKSTWIRVDADRPESIDAAVQLIDQPLVIVAEPAGLALDAPLDAMKLMQAAYRKTSTEPQMAITEAGPGFVAEPIGVTLSTAHYFPEGKKYLTAGSQDFSRFGMSQTGTVVSAKLFPPKGRQIKSLSGVVVKQAKDDRGRPLAVGVDANDQEEGGYSASFQPDGDEPGSAARLDLRLGLPAPDAQTIEELEAEAIAFTIEGWKEMTLTNLQANPTNLLELAEVLPGAKLIIKKITVTPPQTTIDAVLEGPPTLAHVEIKLPISPNSGSSDMSDRKTATAGGKMTRTITISGYEFERNRASAGAKPLSLIIRYPQQMKRERVKFKLTALDLL